MSTRPSFTIDATTRLFQNPIWAMEPMEYRYDVTADGRCLVVVESEEDKARSILVVGKCFAEFKAC